MARFGRGKLNVESVRCLVGWVVEGRAGFGLGMLNVIIVIYFSCYYC